MEGSDEGLSDDYFLHSTYRPGVAKVCIFCVDRVCSDIVRLAGSNTGAKFLQSEAATTRIQWFASASPSASEGLGRMPASGLLLSGKSYKGPMVFDGYEKVGEYVPASASADGAEYAEARSPAIMGRAQRYEVCFLEFLAGELELPHDDGTLSD